MPGYSSNITKDTVRLWILGPIRVCSLFATALTACAIAHAVSASSALATPGSRVLIDGLGAGHKGLSPEVPVPSWAASEAIHFFASPSVGSEATGAVEALNSEFGEIRPDLGPVCEGYGCPEPPLLYHNGAGVQHNPAMHVIFWGKKWTESPGAEAKTQLLKMYEGLSGSPSGAAWQGILTQYFDPTGRVSPSLSVDSYVDTSVAAPTTVNDTKIKEEVVAAVKVKSWAREFGSQFVVIPAPGSTYEASFDKSFCGYHGVDALGSSYTFIPYPGDEPFTGCLVFDAEKNTANVTSMVASHEYAESATDPQVEPFTKAEWYTHNEYEIADICASGDDKLSNGSWVQGIWDDSKGECSLSDKEPPHVYAITERTGEVGPTKATLKGTVNPEGVETKYYFEYGPTTSYGSKTSEVGVGSGTANQAASQSIAGLGEEAVYHYRVTASNGSETSHGEDRTVTTGFWSIDKTPSTGRGSLRGSSCVSTMECTAVGETEGKSLAEAWSLLEGWKIKSTASPPGALESNLQGVSCPASNKCTAVGGYENSSKVDVTLAERWNGTEWAIQSTPNPSGARQSHLNGVSCASSTACTAVGWYENSSGTRMALAEGWNGTEWTIQSTSSSTGGIESDQVSCSSANACTAVRSYYPPGSEYVTARVERWNGTEWHIQETPTVETGGHPAREVSLRGISCAASNQCVAIGRYVASGGGQDLTLAEYWNGSTWQIQSTPTPSTYLINSLNSVSCLSATICMASGQVGNQGVFAERWNGTEWVIQAMPSSPTVGETDATVGVSCVELLRARCIAVGYGGGVPLAESDVVQQTVTTEAATEVAETEATLNGTVNPSGVATKYYFEYGPTTSYGSKTSEVSAGSGTVGVKVSQTLTSLIPGSYHFRIVAVSLAGSSYGTDKTFKAALPNWRITSTPNPAGTLGSYLWGVSCSTASACTSVGGYDTTGASEEKPVAERWNGSTWSVQTPPEPTGTETAELYGTSCGSVIECLGVGVYRKSGVYLSLADFYLSGIGWSELSVTEPTGALSSLLSGASCTSGATCMAVGWYEPSVGVEASYSTQLSSSKWSVKATVNPSGAKGTFPLGVSCTSSSACTLAGYYTNSSGTELPLAERWSGTEWALQTVPVPAGAAGTELRSISCVSSSWCAATGSYWLSEGGTKSLAEYWNGSEWTIQSVPAPAETTSNSLDGVSCTSTSMCMAVGVSHSTSGHNIPLAAQWSGVEWLTQKPPANEEGVGWLSGGVSCTEARWCAAVGNTGKSFAEVYGAF